MLNIRVLKALNGDCIIISYGKECNVKDEVTKKLHDYVSIVKISPEARMEYMMWEEKIFYERKDAKEEEHVEGCNALSGTLIAILEEKGAVMESVRERIISENDFEVLSRWIKTAAKVENVEQFVKEME